MLDTSTGPGAGGWPEADGAVGTQLVASVVEHFQKVTQLARDTTSSFFASLPADRAGMLPCAVHILMYPTTPPALMQIKFTLLPLRFALLPSS